MGTQQRTREPIEELVVWGTTAVGRSLEYHLQDWVTYLHWWRMKIQGSKGQLSFGKADPEAGSFRLHLDSWEGFKVKSCKETVSPSSLERGTHARIQLGNWEMTPKSTDNLGCADILYIQSRTRYTCSPKNAWRKLESCLQFFYLH